MHELQDELDMDSVNRMLEEIDYDEDRLVRQAGQRRMVAYYVPSGPVREEDLRRYLSERLPEELIPHTLVALENIPLTPNGKVDMDALPQPDSGGTARSGDFVAPDGPLETAVAEIWTEVLGVESIGASDGFFHVGGTSLAAMEVMLRICNRFEVDLPLQSIFQADTVAALARLAEARIMEEISELSDQEAEDLANESPR
jgi:acyl carrier protein